jgi:hypothetical protein
MENNNLLKFLIPLVAAVVVFESIVLVTNLDKGVKTNSDTTNKTEATDSAVVQTPVVEEESVADLVFATASKEMKVGKSYKVELNIIGRKDLMIDGIETYVKYDPSLVTVSNLVSNPQFPKSTLSKIDNKSGLISNVVLIDEKAGYKIGKDLTNLVLSFTVVLKKEGETSFEISSGNGNKEFVTMIVENATSKSLTFSNNKLDINVTK